MDNGIYIGAELKFAVNITSTGFDMLTDNLEEATKVYIKISGSWVQSDTLHVKDNGIWKS